MATKTTLTQQIRSFLKYSDDWLTATEIAHKLHASPASVSSILRKMERCCDVDRVRNERGTWVYIQ